MNITSSNLPPLSESTTTTTSVTQNTTVTGPLPGSIKEPIAQTGKQTGKNSKRVRVFIAGLLLLLLVLGAGAALYLTQISQDLRQQASTGTNYGCNPHTGPSYECDTCDANACGGHPDRCHCTGGDACTGTVCDPDIEQQCHNQGRAYCHNYQGFGMTCCVVGYVCCSGYNGCCPGGGPTTEPTRPPHEPTTPPRLSPSPTPRVSNTPTPRLSNTPTPTPRISLTPTPPVGPQCHEIHMYNSDNVEVVGDMDTSLTPGAPVHFRCGASGGNPTSYEFRVQRPDGVIEDKDTNPALEAVGSTSGNYALSMSGKYTVQCRICVGTTCQAYEPLGDDPQPAAGNTNEGSAH